MKRRQSPPNPKHMWPYNATPSSPTTQLLPAKQNSLLLPSQQSLKAQTLNMETQTIIPLSTPHIFFTAYGPKLKVTFNSKPGFGRTKQSFKDDTDINNILARYIQTGTLDFANKHQPQYGDVLVSDFQEAMNLVAQANSMFADLPAALRNRFENDPAKFLDFVQNEANTAEAISLGLGTALTPPPQSPATPLPPLEPAALQQPQNRTPDGQFTFDNPPSGPENDSPARARRAR